MSAIAFSNLAMGIHTILFPWLIVGVLELSPSRLGLAQMAILLPNLLFILPGGVVSDGRHRGSWLSVLYALYIAPVGLLAVALMTEQLSFVIILLFAMMFGTLSAFVQPARESLLGFADPELMHQAVAKIVSIQFIAQGVGFLIAGQMDAFGVVVLLVIQIAMFAASAVWIRRSHPALKISQTPPSQARKPIAELQEGFNLFIQNPALLHLVFLVFATGFLAFGVYLVGMPLIAREGYNLGAEFYAALQIAFMLGIVTANLGVMRRKKMFNRPGRLMIVSFLWRGSLVGIVALLPSLWVLFPVVFVWGFFSGLSMTLGRTILHSQVSHQFRSRAASVYQLSLFGGAPLGAWFCGMAIEWVGLSSTFIVIACMTLLVSTIAALRSPLWSLTRD
jgi:MFS family permease